MTTFHNRIKLGTVLNTTQQPGILGDEADVTAFTVDSATGIENNTNSGRVRVKVVKNTSGGTLAAGILVKPDATGNIDTDVTTCGVSDSPCGIVDPYLSAAVPAGAMFLIVISASRIPVKTGAAYSKGVSLRPNSAGKAVAGSGSFMRALEAATGADESKHVSCNFTNVGVTDSFRSCVQRFVATTAEVNAGLTLLPAVTGVKYRIHDVSMIAIGGNASGATTVDVLGTQSASSVKILASAVAGLTQNTLLRAGAANATILAAGASFAVCDTGTAVTIGKTGPDLATSTAVHVLLTYEVIAG